MITNLETKLELTREGDLSTFLGIQIQKCPKSGSLHLTQEGLIKQVLEATKLEECKPSKPSANKETLGIDKDGNPAQEIWNYCSIVGMLHYLASNSCPDIAFAVHQCAQFSHCPWASHEIDGKKIYSYLKGTIMQGIRYCPTNNFAIDCFVDSDFAGLFGFESSDDPVCAKSCTGYVISLSGCLLLWVSMLQSTIALSTMEAGYQALSASCCVIIPWHHIIQEVAQASEIFTDATLAVHSHSTIYEDNSACLSQAPLPKITPQTKHIAVFYHRFCEYVVSGILCILKVDTNENLADIFTKGLVTDKFTSICKLLCGW